MKQRPAQREGRIFALDQPHRLEADEPPALRAIAVAPSIQSFAVASVMKLLRALATRKISVGTPSWSAMTGLRAKISRARGREKRAKTSPVITAISTRATKFSTVATRWP